MKRNTKLQPGDHGRVAKITGFSLGMVRAVVAGTRNNAKISRAFEELIKGREELDDDLRSQFQPFV
jgi:hypothetical protein